MCIFAFYTVLHLGLIFLLLTNIQQTVFNNFTVPCIYDFNILGGIVVLQKCSALSVRGFALNFACGRGGSGVDNV